MIDIATGQLAFLTLTLGMATGIAIRWIWGDK